VRFSESFAVKVIQNFLFHLARRQHVSPSLFFTLASEILQIMPDLYQDRLGLALSFFEQYFPPAHVGKVSRLHSLDKAGAGWRSLAVCVGDSSCFPDARR
jgi:hypothetical protein